MKKLQSRASLADTVRDVVGFFANLVPFQRHGRRSDTPQGRGVFFAILQHPSSRYIAIDLLESP